MSVWIAFDGGFCPVDSAAVVKARLRSRYETAPRLAGCLDWTVRDTPSDIVAYQVVPPRELGASAAVGDSHEALTFHALPVVDEMKGDCSVVCDRSAIIGSDGRIIASFGAIDRATGVAADIDVARITEQMQSTGARPGDGPPVGVGDVNSTAKGSGARYNGGKAPLDLIPLQQVAESFWGFNVSLTDADIGALDCLELIGQYQARQVGVEALYRALHRLTLCVDGGIEDVWRFCAQVFEYGKRKYAAWNWAKGMAWSIPIGCVARHIIFGLLQDEVNDPESGLPHVGHVACNIVMLIAYAETFQEGDDRPAAGLIGLAPEANDEQSAAA